jgi:hypothetical protein
LLAADGEEEEAAEREEEAELPLDEREEMALEEERGHAGLQYRQHWQKNKRKPTAEVPSSFGKQAKPSSGKKKVLTEKSLTFYCKILNDIYLSLFVDIVVVCWSCSVTISGHLRDILISIHIYFS